MAKFNPGDKVVSFSKDNAYGHCFKIGQIVTVISPECWTLVSADFGDFYAEGENSEGEIVPQYLPENEFELVK